MEEKKIRVIMVDDHHIFRKGVRTLLEEIPDIDLIAEYCNGQEFLDALPTIDTDVVFMDISMPIIDGMETTQKAIAMRPGLKIIALTTYNDENYFNKMIDLGAEGYLLKSSEIDEFEKAIRLVHQGQNYYSNELLTNLTRKLSVLTKIQKGDKPRLPKIEITPKEKEVLTLICKGLSNAEIADEVHLSVRTIEGYRTRLLEKTNTKNSISLVVYAIKNNLVELE